MINIAVIHVVAHAVVVHVVVHVVVRVQNIVLVIVQEQVIFAHQDGLNIVVLGIV